MRRKLELKPKLSLICVSSEVVTDSLVGKKEWCEGIMGEMWLGSWESRLKPKVASELCCDVASKTLTIYDRLARRTSILNLHPFRSKFEVCKLSSQYQQNHCSQLHLVNTGMQKSMRNIANK